MISVARVREVDITLGMPGIVRMVDWGPLEFEGRDDGGRLGMLDSPYHCPAILYRVSQ